MAANATIVLADGKATPTNHSFDPVRVSGNLAEYANFAESFQDGRETLKFSLQDKGSLRKVVVTSKFPRVVDETVNGVTSARTVDFMSAITTFFVPHTWDLAAAKDGRVMHSNSCKNALILDAVDEGKFVY